MDENKKWFIEERAKRAVEALKKNGISAYYVEDAEAARRKVLELVDPKESIGFGGSMTLGELGILPLLEERGNRLITRLEALGAERLRQRREALHCDTFLTSTNALTEDGRLVNIDGTANRVASMVFGPKKVVVIAGYNKLVSNLEEALKRAREVAAPMNAKRLKVKTPCTTTGVCSDCRSADRICNVTTIIDRKPGAVDMYVVVVGDSLGY